MRTIVTSLLLLAAAPLLALAQPAPPSAANLVKFHPTPWRMPVPIMAGMRFEPETGEATVVEGAPSMSAVALARSQAEARAIAAQNVVRHADGSLHAIVGTAFRQYVFVTTDAEGRLEQDCVASEAEMRARLEAAAPKQEHK